MNPWIFLDKNGQDEYIQMFARSCGGQLINTDDFDYDRSQDPIVLRGILKHKIMHRCWRDSRDFYYMDTGYFDSLVTNKRPGVKKLYHRLVKNDLQHRDIVERPNDRWQKLNINLHPRRHGDRIILAVPDEKPCKFYGIDRDRWIQDTVSSLKSRTQRPIVIRQRAPDRHERLHTDPLSAVLVDNVHALVTFNSNAAIESIALGVPVFVLAPTHAAIPVGNTDLDLIDDPRWPDPDKLHAWACHLAYGQFHVRELQDGTAYRILNDNQNFY